MNNIALNKITYILLLIASVILFYFGIVKLFFLFFPFIIGLLISKLITPIVEFLHKKAKLPNNLSTAIMILLVIGLSGYLIYLFVLLVAYYIGEFAKELPNWSNAIIILGSSLSIKFHNLFIELPIDPAVILSRGAASIVSDLGQWGSSFAARGISFATSLPALLISIVITILSAFFFTKDRLMIDALIAPYKRRFFTENRHYLAFRRDVLTVISGYLRAQLILMTVTFSICAAGLTIIKVPHAVPIALGIGFVDALPVLGPASVYFPWILSVIITGNHALAFKLFILYFMTTITRQMIEPKVVGTQIGVHPLLTLSALYIGVKCLGAPGLILGPFTMVALIATYKRYYKKDNNDDFSEL